LLSTQPLQVAVCGAGAFGRNHIRVYRELEAAGQPVHLAAIIEPSPDRARALTDAGWAREWSPKPPPAAIPAPQPSTAIPVFRSLEECLAQVASGALHLDAASVCVPTSAHFEVASALIAAGLHVLIEKPITSTLEQADELIRLGREHHRLIQVGHLERFNPAVAALDSRINRPMFFEAHRLSIFSPRALDVDVVLDLMIHDLDIVLQLAQSPVREVHAVGLPILSPKVDIANVRVEFESGCVANFTASRVSTERVRKLRFFQPHQYVSVDYARQDLLIIAVEKEKTEPAEPLPKASAPLPALAFQKPEIVQGEPLRLEIQAFLDAISGKRELAVPAEQGRHALALALQVQAAMQLHSDRAGLSALY
jgi:predicted dehydrogenase